MKTPSDTANGRGAARQPIAQHSQLFASSTPLVVGEKHNAMASEADFLVQELGLITMRKKALAQAAAAGDSKPEDVPGSRGEDYRELVEREMKLRKRIEDMT